MEGSEIAGWEDSEVTRWERWEDSEVVRLERWASGEVRI